jgi:hypothetical protein
MADLFDVNAPIAQEENNSNKNYANEFRPKSKDGQGGVWESVIRFLPNPKNPVDSIASGSTVFLTAPDGRRKEVYCNPNSYQCPITSTFFTLKDNPNPILKERAKTFSKKQRYASLIQVVQCKAHPDLVGKILVWRYGKTVHDKLIQENHPTSEFIQARNPFSIIAGRPFYVKVVQAGGGTPWDNYDQCTFIDPADALAVKCPVQQADGSVVSAPVTAQTLQNPEFKAIVEKWLIESSPSLEQYKYSEWDDETRNFVTDCIKAALNPNSQQNAQQAAGIFAGAPQPAAAPVVESVTPITVPQGAPAQPVAPHGGGFASSNIPNLDGILAGGSPSGAAPQPVAPAQQAAPAAPVQQATPAQPAAPQPAAAPAGAPAGGLNLNDILGDIV